MSDSDKASKVLAPFVTLLAVMFCIWGAIEILNHIWFELLILLAVFGTLGIVVAVLWLRFRKW